MRFLRQIGFEIKNILKSKFILITGILVLASSVGIPLLRVLAQSGEEEAMPMYMSSYDVAMAEYERAVPIEKFGYFDEDLPDSVTVDGQTITQDNPFFWNIGSIMREKTIIETDKELFSTPEALDLALELMDAEIAYYAQCARHIAKPEDYRMELAWAGAQTLRERFIYSHADEKPEALLEVIQFRLGMDEEPAKTMYVDLPPIDRMKALDRAEERIGAILEVVSKDDFPRFIELRMQQEQDNIKDLEEQIAIQEKAIIDNPLQEESIGFIIEDLKKQISMIQTNTLPTLQYRLKKNIKPGERTWQNNAIDIIGNNRNELLFTEIITEENFNKELQLVREYGSYARYLAIRQARIDELNNEILIGQRSLDADKPDMRYVPDGARNQTVEFLSYSVFVALFAVLLGGWIMASEFQQGTIRLLMIRPRTRVKILMSKFLAAFLVCLFIYVAGSLMNMATNGVCFGFADYGYPNYTAAGEINFFAYYFPEFFACMATILFAYAVAFMFSVIVKNTAVAIIIPVICYIGYSIGITVMAYSRLLEWVAYTPLPYVQISYFFTQYSPVRELIGRGLPLSLAYGIPYLLALTAIFMILSIAVFRKRDITN